MEFNLLERQNVVFHLVPREEIYEYCSISHPKSGFILQDEDLKRLYKEFKDYFISFTICKN